MRLEQTVISNLIYDEDYTRRVLPFLKPDYFQDQTEKVLFQEIDKFVEKYNGLPTKETLLIELNKRNDIPENTFASIIEYIDDLTFEKKDSDWLLDSTEEFCKQKAIYNAIVNSIEILDGNSQNVDRGNIPTLLTEALGVSFDDHIGHDFIENADERYEFYNRKEDKVAFDLEYFNLITGGGLPNKTLNIVMAPTGAGKSLFMCHFAAANMLAGKNALYITLEMAEENI